MYQIYLLFLFLPTRQRRFLVGIYQFPSLIGPIVTTGRNLNQANLIISVSFKGRLRVIPY